MRTKASDGGRTFTDLARRAQIAQCAADVIAEAGHADASMAEIARRAGVAKSVVSTTSQTKRSSWARCSAPL